MGFPINLTMYAVPRAFAFVTFLTRITRGGDLAILVGIVFVKIRKLWAWRYDLLLWIGGAVAVYGVVQIYLPAGVIVAGLGIIGWAMMGAKTQA